MSSTSVSAWLEELKEGESHAAEKLWRHYLHRLLGLARKKLGSRRSALADEDDAVNDAFADFLRGMEGRQFAKLDDRHDLWQVLVVLTERRVVDQIRHELAVKRGAGRMKPPGVGGADVRFTEDNKTASARLRMANRLLPSRRKQRNNCRSCSPSFPARCARLRSKNSKATRILRSPIVSKRACAALSEDSA